MHGRAGLRRRRAQARLRSEGRAAAGGGTVSSGAAVVTELFPTVERVLAVLKAQDSGAGGAGAESARQQRVFARLVIYMFAF